MLTGALTRVPGEDVGGYTINKGDLRLISGNYTLADDAFTPAALASIRSGHRHHHRR